jgi:N-acetylmuramoyl-L-alanine amidase
MSASLTNTGLELIKEIAPASAIPGSEPTIASREALQALLAFSALHQQVRGRRASREAGGEDIWQLEQFVLDEVLQLVAERALTITGADGVAVALAEDHAIVCRASAGMIAPDRGARVEPDSGFSGACLVSGRVFRCDNAESDSRVDPVACERLGVRSMVAVPLSAKSAVIGLLEAFSSEPFGFNDSDVRSLSLLAELVLSALRPAEEDRLAEISRRVVERTLPAPAAPEIAPVPEPQLVIACAEAASEEPPEKEESIMPAAVLAAPPRRPGLAVVVALVIFAAALAVGLGWNIHRNSHPTAVAATTTPMAQPTKPAVPVSTPPPSEVEEDPSTLTPATPEQAGVFPKVTGIRHWTSADSSTVVIDLQDQVQYEAHRLSNPERIYFDLHDTKLADELSGKQIIVQDPLLQRIRIAQPVIGITRIVLDTKGASNFSVSLEQNPYRLVVEVRKLGAKPQDRAKIDLFAPADQTATQAESASTQPTPTASASAIVGKPGAPASVQTSQLRIVLDAGHGGWDLGTVGRNGLQEKDLVLDIVERLGRLVETRLKAEVIYTRKDDNYLALEKRAEIANTSHADLFLSVHANYSDYSAARGVETYYTNTYSSIKARTSDAAPQLQNINWTSVDIREKVLESKRLAASVQHSLYGTLAKRNPGLPNRGIKEAQYVVLTGTSMPAVLAEVSFVSSPADENNLQSASYRQQIAEALYQGLARYSQQDGQVKLASNPRKPGKP